MQSSRKSMWSWSLPTLLFANAFSRKEKQVGQVFGQAFSWVEAIDAVADVYNGVRLLDPFVELMLMDWSLSSGQCWHP